MKFGRRTDDYSRAATKWNYIALVPYANGP